MFTRDSLVTKIRIGLPSKGRMYDRIFELFSDCGLTIRRENRRYLASIEEIPEIEVVFLRQEDIVEGVKSGVLSFGIAGLDLINEYSNPKNETIIIHDELGFGRCTLEIAVPDSWDISSVNKLSNGKTYRVASKFPQISAKFLQEKKIPFEFVSGAGTLEVSPALGNADFIIDLVSTGQTLVDNRLKRLKDGTILSSEATFFANRINLSREEDLKIALLLLELFEATLRARNFLSVQANMRGEPNEVMKRIFESDELSGLNGPTISPIYAKDGSDMFAMHIIASRRNLSKIINEIRELGGSGVVVSKVDFIFEETPQRYTILLENLRSGIN
ncbi:MAG: ATP phosphoribosyltransferase [Candidatus Heimdallarchaeota archaeon]|nr:ATP phosphoribosyltransferase [Candidatus Heimdallarchaeota archaeon]